MPRRDGQEARGDVGNQAQNEAAQVPNARASGTPQASLPGPSPLTVANLREHNAAVGYESANEVYRRCLLEGRATLDRLRQSSTEQQWEPLISPPHGTASDEAVEDLLEYFGLLSVEHIDVCSFTQPLSDATPLGRFLADIPSGINRRLYDLVSEELD